MNGLKGALPEGATPTLGPDATGIGWTFQYALTDKSGKHGLDELRTFQDFTLRYALGSVPGVAEVASVGGYQKQYQVTVDPNRLRAYGVTLTEVIDAIRQSNNDVGGRIIEFSGREYYVRGRGYIHDLGAIEKIALRTSGPGGTPLLVKDVATVRFGPEHPPRAARMERRRRGGGRRGGHPLRRERARRHRAGQEEARGAQARRFPEGVELDGRLRSIGAHRALHRHAQACAHRGGGRRQPGDHAVPAATFAARCCRSSRSRSAWRSRSSRWCCSTSRRRS